MTLSDATALDVDHVVFACGYRADVAGVPYLRGCLDQLESDDGFPVLDELPDDHGRPLRTGFSATKTSVPSSGS